MVICTVLLQCCDICKVAVFLLPLAGQRRGLTCCDWQSWQFICWHEKLERMLMELQDLGWLCMVVLFLAALLIVLAWFVQYSLAVLRLWRAKWTAKQDKKESAWLQFLPKWLKQNQDGGVWGILTGLRSGWDGRAATEAGIKGLLASLFSFKSFREHWQKTWVKALNEQASRHGVSWLCEMF